MAAFYHYAWLAYFGFQLAAFVISSALKLWELLRGRRRRFSRALLAEELLGTLTTAAALVGLWGYIQQVPFGFRELWQLVLAVLVALIALQPLLPRSRLLRDRDSGGAARLVWFWNLVWSLPLLLALWHYAQALRPLYP
ncbi:MAG: hypothetical protein AAF515_19040 [Pseudomonadota bacterium]